jgi:hypothetical protein
MTLFEKKMKKVKEVWKCVEERKFDNSSGNRYMMRLEVITVFNANYEGEKERWPMKMMD